MSDRGAFIPEDWCPSEDDVTFARRLGLKDIEIVAIAETFKDYWMAAAGQNARKRSWPATWRNWVRKEAEKRGKRGLTAGATAAAGRRDAIAAGFAGTFGGEDGQRSLFGEIDGSGSRH